MSNKLTIADWLKYAEYLDDRLKSIKTKINQTEIVKTKQVVVAHWDTTNVVEQTEFILNPKALMSEYDETAKELRLVRQAIEKANHTIELEFVAKF